jgi:YidC/Oxa1 family membrane protein insertase
MAWLFHELFYRPLFNILIFLYQIIPGADMGIAVVLTTIVVRLILFPLYKRSIKSQQELAVVQPLMKELQEKYKDDKQKLSEELMKLYSEHKVNPFAGIIIVFAQMPILFAIYRVSLNIFNVETYPEFYNFVSFPETINAISLGSIPIAESAWDTRNIAAIILVLLVGITQYYQVKFMMKRTQPPKKESSSKKSKKKKEKEPEPDMAQAMGKQMALILPIMITGIALSLPTAMSFYWITTTVFTIGQEVAFGKKLRSSTTPATT